MPAVRLGAAAAPIGDGRCGGTRHFLAAAALPGIVTYVGDKVLQPTNIYGAAVGDHGDAGLGRPSGRWARSCAACSPYGWFAGPAA
jgi:hypothetical protein